MRRPPFITQGDVWCDTNRVFTTRVRPRMLADGPTVFAPDRPLSYGLAYAGRRWHAPATNRRRLSADCLK